MFEYPICVGSTLHFRIVLMVSAFIIGSIFGSAFLCFLDRKNRGEPWTKGRSHCASCGRELTWKDLIPIYSYLRNKGKCRYCGKPYPVATLLSELAMGYAWLCAASEAYLAYLAGDYPGMVTRALIYILLGAASVNDICCHECEYVIQYGTLAVGVVYAFFFCEDAAVLLGCAGVMGVLVLIDFLFRKIRRVEGIGFADIIVMTGAAAIVDKPILVPAMVLLTCLFSILSVPIALKNQKMQGMEEDGLGIGLLPFVLIGLSVCNLLGRTVIPWLFSC